MRHARAHQYGKGAIQKECRSAERERENFSGLQKFHRKCFPFPLLMHLARANNLLRPLSRRCRNYFLRRVPSADVCAVSNCMCEKRRKARSRVRVLTLVARYKHNLE